MQGMGEGGEFPGAEVSSQKQNAFAAGVGALEVLEPVVDYDAGDVFARVAGEKADFGELASERNENTAQDAASLAATHLGEREGEVAHADSAQASVKQVHHQPEGDSFGPRQGTGEQADGLNPQPDDCVFETMAHCAGV